MIDQFIEKRWCCSSRLKRLTLFSVGTRMEDSENAIGDLQILANLLQEPVF
jgi:hypothetical protein